MIPRPISLQRAERIAERQRREREHLAVEDVFRRYSIVCDNHIVLEYRSDWYKQLITPPRPRLRLW